MTADGEDIDGGQKKRRDMASLSALRQQDKDQDIRGYGTDKLSSVLSKVQKGDQDQCGPEEDGFEQRARRIDAEPAPRPFGSRLFLTKRLPVYLSATSYLHLSPAAHPGSLS